MPGIHINISKSGFSTNVGVKGASVTFGQNGTYINTGLPGTGLYRRDKISGSSLENNEHENSLCSVPLNDGGLEVVAPKRGSFLCFLKNLIRKIGLLHDDRQEEISVFTHQGDLVKLPQGATILDYALEFRKRPTVTLVAVFVLLALGYTAISFHACEPTVNNFYLITIGVVCLVWCIKARDPKMINLNENAVSVLPGPSKLSEFNSGPSTYKMAGKTIIVSHTEGEMK